MDIFFRKTDDVISVPEVNEVNDDLNDIQSVIQVTEPPSNEITPQNSPKPKKSKKTPVINDTFLNRWFNQEKRLDYVLYRANKLDAPPIEIMKLDYQNNNTIGYLALAVSLTAIGISLFTHVKGKTNIIYA